MIRQNPKSRCFMSHSVQFPRPPLIKSQINKKSAVDGVVRSNIINQDDDGSLSQTPRKKQKIIYRKSKALYVVLTRSRGKETVTTLTWKEIIEKKKKKIKKKGIL